MKLSIGIIGLPNAGKSTLFKELTKRNVPIASYPFTTIDPNHGVVAAKDERLEKLAQIFHSKGVFPAALEFVDIAGLVRGAHKGEGLGNQFLSHIREVDAVIHLIRSFEASDVPHIENTIDPARDFEIVKEELKRKDEQSKEKENLLSAKPQLIVLNGLVGEVPRSSASSSAWFRDSLIFDLKRGLSDADIKKIFSEILRLLELITFFTVNENEARSWFVKKGTPVVKAAGVIHTDFESKFIKAEVINWQKLVEAGNWNQARNKGLIRLEGRDYIVEEGDVVLVKHG